MIITVAGSKILVYVILVCIIASYISIYRSNMSLLMVPILNFIELFIWGRHKLELFLYYRTILYLLLLYSPFILILNLNLIRINVNMGGLDWYRLDITIDIFNIIVILITTNSKIWIIIMLIIIVLLGLYFLIQIMLRIFRN